MTHFTITDGDTQTHGTIRHGTDQRHRHHITLTDLLQDQDTDHSHITIQAVTHVAHKAVTLEMAEAEATQVVAAIQVEAEDIQVAAATLEASETIPVAIQRAPHAPAAQHKNLYKAQPHHTAHQRTVHLPKALQPTVHKLVAVVTLEQAHVQAAQAALAEAADAQVADSAVADAQAAVLAAEAVVAALAAEADANTILTNTKHNKQI